MRLTHLLVASLCHAQLQDAVLRFTHTDGPDNVRAVSTVIRSVGEINQLSVDPDQRTMSMRVNPEQLAMANWLAPQLDIPPNTIREPAPQHRFAGNENDIVRVLYLNNAQTVQQVQEIATTTRSIAEISRAFTYNPAKAFVVRGSPAQVAMAEWLVPRLDLPAETPATGHSPEHRMGGSSDDLVRVFYLSNIQSIQELQEMSTVIRSIGEIRRAFTYNSAKALAMRGTPDQLALAEWLIGQLNRPTAQISLPSSEYRMAAIDAENLVRVLVLKDTPTVQQFQQRAVQIRTAVGLRRAFTYNAHRAFVVRGTSTQIAEASRLAAE